MLDCVAGRKVCRHEGVHDLMHEGAAARRDVHDQRVVIRGIVSEGRRRPLAKHLPEDRPHQLRIRQIGGVVEQLVLLGSSAQKVFHEVAGWRRRGLVRGSPGRGGGAL